MIWKDYKADLKKKHFDANLTDKELMDRRDLRVNEAQWKWLINHWRSPEAVVRHPVLFAVLYIKIAYILCS